MDIHRLRDMASNPQFISGIYNYCDRWCERCRFTSRCSIYVAELEMRAERWGADRPDDDAAANQRDLRIDMALDFPDDTEEPDWNLADLVEFDEAGEEDDEWETPFDDDEEDEEFFDFEDEDDEDSAIDRQILQEKIDGHPCATMSYEYVGMVTELLRDLSAGIDSGRPGGSDQDTAMDAVELISWYRFFIHAKLKRALSGLFDDPLEGLEDMEDMPHDRDGSAKIGLIAIDRSIDAWETVSHLAANREQVLQVIEHLQILREKTEATFPDARLFVRPGFDTEEP